MIETQANAILGQYWDGMLSVDVEGIAHRMGAIVSRWPDMGDTSGIIQIQNGAPVIYVNQYDAEVRQRFTIAHELGHWALRHITKEGDMLPRDNRLTYSMSSSWIEREANQFAAAFLMPSDAVEFVIQSGHATTLETLAKVFGVSKAAMQFRVNNLGLFSAI